MIDFIRCHFCSRANSILEATRRFLIVHSPALFPSMCKSVETCLYKNRRRKKRIHKDGERDQSYLVGDSFVFRYKRGSRRRTRWGDPSVLKLRRCPYICECMEILWTSYLSLLVALQSAVGGHRTRSQSGEDPHHNNMIPLNWSTVYFLNIWSN